MKFLTSLIIVLSVFNISKAQVIIDTSRCNTIKTGHLKLLIDEFKNNCPDKNTNYSFTEASFSASETIAFLNGALKTKIFNRYCFLERSTSEIQSSEDKINYVLGMAEIGFKSKKELEKAVSIIKSYNNNYFYLEVATQFVLLKEDDTLIIIYSEISSPNNSLINCFFERLKTKKKQYIPIGRT